MKWRSAAQSGEIFGDSIWETKTAARSVSDDWAKRRHKYLIKLVEEDNLFIFWQRGQSGCKKYENFLIFFIFFSVFYINRIDTIKEILWY